MYHFSVCVKAIHAAGDTVAVASDPQSGALIHLAAAGVEEVIVRTDFGKAQGQHIILIVICISAAGNKTGFDQLSLSIEGMPISLFGNQTVLLTDPNCGVDYKAAVRLSMVVTPVSEPGTSILPSDRKSCIPGSTP